MIQIKKLYSNPSIFTPISFEIGLNIILGEKVNELTSSNRKTNGVGKSMCIEFINFCLLNKFSDGRLKRIPNDVLAPEVQIILDLEINDYKLSIIRTKGNPEQPDIIKDNETQTFVNLEDAKKYLMNLINPDNTSKISFRELISPLIRDEKSEFRDIISCNDLIKNIPPNYTPHLYFFGIDTILYQEIKKAIDNLDKTTKYLAEIKKDLERQNSSKDTIQSDINDLKKDIDIINKSVEELKNIDAFDSIQKDIIHFENQLDLLRVKQKSISYELKKIESLPELEQITETDIEIIYNQFKEGLGNLAMKTLEQVQLFKLKIDKFQRKMLSDKANILKNELATIGEKIKKVDADLQNKQKVLDVNGNLRQLKTSISIMNKKNEEYQKKLSIYNNLTEIEDRKKDEKKYKNELIEDKLRKVLKQNEQVIKSFEETILEIHYAIMGNGKASFEIKEFSSKIKFIDFILRIHDDGSHSVNRTKVFIYDLSLLLNYYTRQRHPKFLIHDNIFDVDQDTLIQSLNFLYKSQENHTDFQYILTLNRDKIENEEKLQQIIFDIDKIKRATFTKENKFLSKDYEESK